MFHFRKILAFASSQDGQKAPRQPHPLLSQCTHCLAVAKGLSVASVQGPSITSGCYGCWLRRHPCAGRVAVPSYGGTLASPSGFRGLQTGCVGDRVSRIV